MRRLVLLPVAVLLAAATDPVPPQPLRGQSAAQQERDLGECAAQARQRSGHDPAQPQPGLVTDATKGAAAGAATGLLAGDATRGAATGAAAAAMRHRSQSAAAQEKLAAYDKERAACLQARGYALPAAR